MSIGATWGTTAGERGMSFPCDRLIEQADAAYFRGVTVDAPASVIFRWLCQLRVAPYSYDWIDNFGRQSPRELTPGLDGLAAGQRVMGSFTIADFERDRHLTIRMMLNTPGGRLFRIVAKDLAVSYLVAPRDDGACRLLVKLLARYRSGPAGWLARFIVPWADLIMMRKQLLNLKKLSEETALGTGDTWWSGSSDAC